MRYFVPQEKDDVVGCPEGASFKCMGDYFDTRDEAQEFLNQRKHEAKMTLTDEEKYFLQREYEDEIMRSFYLQAPNKSKDELITLFAQTAVALSEGVEDDING